MKEDILSRRINFLKQVSRATLIEHGLAELDEQAVGTKQGARWLPGRWGRETH
jgi:hypothetical protein